jgi:IS5 family transposase
MRQTIARNIARIDAQALREMNERLCVIARERGVIRGRVYRQDTTVCETNIHYPTDSSLLGDGVRVLQRTLARAEDLLPSLGRMRDRSRSVRRRVIEISRSTGRRGEEGRQRRETSYRKLLRTVRPVVTAAKQVANKLGDGRVTRRLGFLDALAAEGLKQELDTMAPRVETVIQQTRARICRGITDYPDKLLSLFEPRTCVIRKGKAQRWRANGEGRIGILKNVYGLDRCMYKGNEAMERWVGWCVFANNLVVVARAIRRQEHRDETAATPQRKDARQAA